MSTNLFTSLSSYDSTNQPENYLTESFVFLLRELLDREGGQAAALAVINGLAGETAFQEVNEIRLETQAELKNGILDIEIRVGRRVLVYVEVKHNSPLGYQQLERYLDDLNDHSDFQFRRLTLLTRSHQSALETSLQPDAFQHVCWYQIYHWLSHADVPDPVCGYLIDHFLAFLEEKNMALKKVTWEYMQGVPAMQNLTSMIEAALEESLPGKKIRRTGGWNWRGFYFDRLFCGTYYNKPLNVCFENIYGSQPTYLRELSLESSHFFALESSEQFDKLTEFICQAYAEAPQALKQADANAETALETLEGK